MCCIGVCVCNVLSKATSMSYGMNWENKTNLGNLHIWEVGTHDGAEEWVGNKSQFFLFPKVILHHLIENFVVQPAGEMNLHTTRHFVPYLDGNLMHPSFCDLSLSWYCPWPVWLKDKKSIQEQLVHVFEGLPWAPSQAVWQVAWPQRQ